MVLEFSGEIFYWKGPAPWHFVSVPEPEAAALADVSRDVTYGWGMIPVTVELGGTTFTTSLWPKDGGYVVPLKTHVRRTERLDVGDEITLRLTV